MIKLYTSFVDRDNLERIIEKNLLPIFIIRSLGKIDYIERWAGTPLHFKELSPSKELFWDFRDKKIDFNTFSKRFLLEICEVDFIEILKKFKQLLEFSEASGIVLLGMGKNPEFSHRRLVADILWRVGNLSEKPKELC